ncbi:hypothetical protein QRD25_24480 (plasmid) [Serratia marcescens]|nr:MULTISPECIES: hypothetical protein [Serratia]MDM1819218.1 hypothetical protein [Serratia ureilytica]WJD90501.1 hypothetical protein QRD25_24480 [Serratia marcescens]
MKPSLFRHPVQPVREHFGGVFALHGAGKTQSALAQDALIWVGAQERFHQHGEPPLLCFSRGVIDSAS